MRVFKSIILILGHFLICKFQVYLMIKDGNSSCSFWSIFTLHVIWHDFFRRAFKVSLFPALRSF